MSQKIIERNALAVSAAVTSCYTALGLWAYLATDIQALFLDFFFSLLGLFSSIGAIVINRFSRRRTPRYPHGLYFLEPLYAVLKSLLTLALLFAATANSAKSAFEYFLYGSGTPLFLAPVLPYTAVAAGLCFGLGIYNMHQNKRIGGISTLLQSESRTNIIDGLQSLGIGIGALILQILGENAGFMRYTGDFFITALMVLISVPRPVMLLISAFSELSGAASRDNNIRTMAKSAVEEFIPGAGFEIYKVGTCMRLFVFPDTVPGVGAKDGISKKMSEFFEDIEVIICI